MYMKGIFVQQSRTTMMSSQSLMLGLAGRKIKTWFFFFIVSRTLNGTNINICFNIWFKATEALQQACQLRSMRKELISSNPGYSQAISPSISEAPSLGMEDESELTGIDAEEESYFETRLNILCFACIIQSISSA